MQDHSSDARYAPPQAHVEDVPEAVAGPGELATRGRRLAAVLIDGGLSIGVLWLLSRLTPYNIWAHAGESPLSAARIGDMLAGFVLFLVLQGYLLATRGQTIGKALLKIRITRPDGSKPSFGRLIGLRYGLPSLLALFPILLQVYSVIDCLFIFRSSRRCLHDQIADTIVLKA